MLSDKDFIDRVWSKYEVYSKKQEIRKNKFFSGNLYKNAHSTLVLKTCALFMFVITVTTLIGGGTYAVIKDVSDKNKVVKEESIIEKKEDHTLGFASGGFILNDPAEMTLEDGIYYKKIDNYEEYLKFNKEFENIPQMTENDFNAYFLIVMTDNCNASRMGMYIDSIDKTDEVIKFNIRKNINDDTRSICLKLSRENDKKKIDFEFFEEMPNMTGYVNIDDLPYDYSKKQAIDDNCVVLEGEGIGLTGKCTSKCISGREKFEEFINNSTNGINGNIRIVEYKTSYRYKECDYNSDGAFIIDIEFNNGRYIVCADFMRIVMNTEQYDYKEDDYKLCFSSYEAKILEFENGKEYIWRTSGEDLQNAQICIEVIN